MSIQFHPLALALAMAAGLGTPLASAEVVKVAFIEPLSGPFAAVGQNLLRSWQFIAELGRQGKWAGDDSFEVVPLDSKGTPQEALTQLKAAIDQGIRYVTQGSGSGVGLALIDAINKHNERNPGQEIVYLNYGSLDPDIVIWGARTRDGPAPAGRRPRRAARDRPHRSQRAGQG